MEKPVTTAEQLELEERIAKLEADRVNLENSDKKADQRRTMAWLAMGSIVALTILLLTPLIGAERIAALSDLLTMFYIAQAGIVSVFFGSDVYMSVNKES